MNRLMTSRRQTRPVPYSSQKLNPSVIQRQAVSNFQEKKSLFHRGISCLGRLWGKVTSLFDPNRRTSYSGPLKEVKEAFYINNRGEQIYVKILGFRGISKAIVKQWNGTFCRSVHRLQPISPAIPV